MKRPATFGVDYYRRREQRALRRILPGHRKRSPEKQRERITAFITAIVARSQVRK